MDSKESLLSWHETLQKIVTQFLSMMGLNQTADLCHREFDKQRQSESFKVNINNSPFLISNERLMLSVNQLKQLLCDIHIILASNTDSSFNQNACNYESVLQKRKADQDMQYFIHEQRKNHAIENQIEFVDTSTISFNTLQIPSRLLTKKLHRGILIKKDRVDNLEGPLAQTVFPFIKNTKEEKSQIQGSDGLVIHREQEFTGNNTTFHPPCYGLLYHSKRKDTMMILEERLTKMEEYLMHSQDHVIIATLRPTTHPAIPSDVYVRLKRLETALLRIEMKYPSIALKEFHSNIQLSLYE